MYKQGENVLLLWGPGNNPESLKEVVEEINGKVGNSGKVQVEHVDRLTLSGHGTSRFDVIVSGHVLPATTVHSAKVLAELVKILKPGGTFYLREPTTDNKSTFRTADQVKSALMLAGFVNIIQSEQFNLSDDDKQQLKAALNVENVGMLEFSAKKPEYEIGASVPLNLPWAQKANESKEDVAAVWSLSATDMMDEDVELVNDDELLDDEDLVKPDPNSLKLTASGKKKACKNCSCGLAEELETEVTQKKKPSTENATSACGNCYLGDAFRCASCPYLGMPAFEPGEKIQLTDQQMAPDQ